MLGETGVPDDERVRLAPEGFQKRAMKLRKSGEVDARTSYSPRESR